MKKSIIWSALGFVVFASSIYSYKNPSKYSKRWIENLSDDEWEKERETVRLKLSNNQNGTEVRFYSYILSLFDKVKSKKDWNGVEPYGPSYPREHGYNLYKEE